MTAFQVFLSVVIFLQLGYSQICRSKCETFVKDFQNTSKVIAELSCLITETCPLLKDSQQPDILRSNIPRQKWSETQQWYKYKNSINGHYNLALNFSWIFDYDSSLENVQGYTINITKLNSKEAPFTVNYCFQTQPIYERHKSEVFYYDCYGVTDSTFVTPGDHFKIDIKSIPDYSTFLNIDYNHLTVDVSVPDCTSPDMDSVYDCILKRQLTVKIKRFCANNTIKVKYSVPSQPGEFAHVLLCHGEDHDFKMCLSKVFEWKEAKLNDTFWYRIPDSFYLKSSNYTVVVLSSLKKSWHARTVFNFKTCPNDTFKISPVIVAIIGFVTFAILAILMAAYRFDKRCSSFLKGVHYQKEDKSSESVHLCNVSLTEDFNSKNQISVYLLFTDDHPKHKEVIINFACFLKTCGFYVIFELWDEEKFCLSITQWMENSLCNADKVIVIWSPGATLRWKYYYNNTNHNVATLSRKSLDTFAPVVEQIFKDLFINAKTGKYYFAFFDYGDSNCIVVPQLQRQVSKIYCLMKDFTELYCCLKDTEIYLPCGKTRLVEKNTSCQEALKSSIEDMRNLVKNCESWHKITTCNADFSKNHPILESTDKIRNILYLPSVYFVKNESNCESCFQVEDIVSVIERPRFPVLSVEPLHKNTNPHKELAAFCKV